MTYLEAAYTILSAANAPLHYEEITSLALEQGLIAPTGRTPAATMGSRLYTNTKDESSRFVRKGRGMFALVDERHGDIGDQVAAITHATRDQLRILLQDMPPDRFEALITELLLQMGFDESTVIVTPYSGDGGIDVVGIYRAAGLAEVNAAVQVKRWRGNVRAPVVTQLRGSLQVHQQGIIITTSDFSTGARTEASAPGKVRIGCINGEELLDLLFKHKVGVIEKPLTVTTLDDGWWGELITPSIDAPRDQSLDSDVTSGETDKLRYEAGAQEEIPSGTNSTGKKPCRLVIQGSVYPTSSWRNLLLTVCDHLATEFREEFPVRVLALRGSKRAYFAATADVLHTPAKLADQDLWVETNQSAHSVLKLIDHLLDLFEIPRNALTVETS